MGRTNDIHPAWSSADSGSRGEHGDDQARSLNGMDVANRSSDRQHSHRVPVVFVHGFMQSSHTWDDVMACLRSDMVPYTFSWPDGSTDQPGDQSCSLDHAVESLGQFLEHVSDQHPMAPLPMVVGYSMGGRIAISLVEHGMSQGRRPSIGGLLLESPGLGPNDEQQRQEMANRNHEWAERLRKDGLPSFVDWWEGLDLFASQRDLPERIRRRVREDRLRQDPMRLAAQLEQAGQHCMADRPRNLQALDWLANAHRPVRYMAGSRDRKYAAIANDLDRHWESTDWAQSTIVDGVGHSIHLEDPEAFCAHLAELVSAVRNGGE